MSSKSKPRHTTCKKRHGAGDRLSKRLYHQERLVRELRSELESLTHGHVRP